MAVFIYFENLRHPVVCCVWQPWTTASMLLIDSVVVAGAKTVTGYFQVSEYWDALTMIVAASHGRV